MSDLTKENIQEWFFRYTEGTLSGPEKDLFMDYLLENPEYNDEFVYWANTKITVDENLADYDLQKGLMMAEPLPLNRSKRFKWLTFTAVAVIAVSASYYFKPEEVKIRARIDRPHTAGKPKNTLQKLEPIKPDKATVKPTNTSVTTETKKPTTAHVETPSAKLEDTIGTLQSPEPVAPQQESIKEIVVPQTDIPTSDIEKAKASKEKQTKPKGKFSLKPSNKFRKDHADF